MIFLYCYIFISFIILIRLIYYFLFQIDSYERRNVNNEFWKISILTILLWPISILVNHKYLSNPSSSFTHQLYFADITRKKDEFMRNPPFCGSTIKYKKKDCLGDFNFSAADIQNFLISKFKQKPQSVNWVDNAILNWVSNREESSQEISDIPQMCSDFDNIANNLIRAGIGRVFCSKCGKEFESSELLINDSTEKSGWFYFRILCSQKHILLKVKGAHYYFG